MVWQTWCQVALHVQETCVLDICLWSFQWNNIWWVSPWKGSSKHTHLRLFHWKCVMPCAIFAVLLLEIWVCRVLCPLTSNFLLICYKPENKEMKRCGGRLTIGTFILTLTIEIFQRLIQFTFTMGRHGRISGSLW